MSPAKVLFVCYGGGHAHMVIPVARALAASGWGQPRVLALTSAAAPVREAGLPLLQFKDFLDPSDTEARRWGERLLGEMPAASIDPEESVAYLGLSFAELVRAHGEAEALRLYRDQGRSCFLPVDTLARILARERPDLVVSTTSPRAEQAAFLAARAAGIPALCLVDSFVRDEAERLAPVGRHGAICVINASVRQTFMAAGAAPGAVHCTGNPAFDPLIDPAQVAQGRALRERLGGAGRSVVLYPTQTFHAWHPLIGAWDGHDLPQRVQDRLVAWAQSHEDALLCIRPRPDEAAPALPAGGRLLLTGGRDWPLAPLLHAVDVVVTVSSTVGLEGHLAGARVIQVLGTPFDSHTPWLQAGIADRAVALDDLLPALDEVRQLPRRAGGNLQAATPRVLAVMRELVTSS